MNAFKKCMYILGTSAYFLLKGCFQTNLQSAVRFGFIFCPVFVETNFSRTVGSSLPPAIGTPHKLLLVGMDGPYFCGGRKGVGCIRLPEVPFVILFS